MTFFCITFMIESLLHAQEFDFEKNNIFVSVGIQKLRKSQTHLLTLKNLSTRIQLSSALSASLLLQKSKSTDFYWRREDLSKRHRVFLVYLDPAKPERSKNVTNLYLQFEKSPKLPPWILPSRAQSTVPFLGGLFNRKVADIEPCVGNSVVQKYQKLILVLKHPDNQTLHFPQICGLISSSKSFFASLSSVEWS